MFKLFVLIKLLMLFSNLILKNLFQYRNPGIETRPAPVFRYRKMTGIPGIPVPVLPGLEALVLIWCGGADL